jgi:hypothetical protein
MGLEELLALLVRQFGASVVLSALRRLVGDAPDVQLRSRGGCGPYRSQDFDADELGIYDEEDYECRG